MCWVSHVLTTHLLSLSSSLWLSQLSPTTFPWEAHPAAGSDPSTRKGCRDALQPGVQSHTQPCAAMSPPRQFSDDQLQLYITDPSQDQYSVHVPPYLTLAAQEMHRIWHLASQIFILWEDEAWMLLPGWQNLKIKSPLRGYIGLL